MPTPDQLPTPKIEELLPSVELLAYYRSRVADFEKEREALLESIEKCSTQQAELHTLRWENRKREQEIQELQKAISDAHNFLYEERQRLLALQAENDELRLQEIEDRKRIQQLLAMTQPLEQEITYGRENFPNTVTLFPKHVQPIKPERPKTSDTEKERVLRTVFLPTANADFLLLKLESLQAQLNEQKQLSNERISALLEDRRIREQEEDAHRANLNQQVEHLMQKLKKTEESLRETTKEYILARRQQQELEGRVVAADAQLIQDRQRHAEDMQQVKTNLEQQLKNSESLAEAKREEYVQNFREQVQAREEELQKLTAVHNAMKSQYDRSTSDLESKVAKLTEQQRQLEHRRQLDLEGFTADVTALRRQVLTVDRKLHQMRLVERLEDDDRLDTLLANLQLKTPAQPDDRRDVRPRSAGRKAPAAGKKTTGKARGTGKAVAGSSGQTTPRSIKSELAEELQIVRGKIKGLDEQLAVKRKSMALR